MIIRLNGKEIVIDKDEVHQNPKAAALDWLRQYRKENAMEPTIEQLGTTGVKATFPDGAAVTLTVSGRFPCTLCGDGHCEHFHTALEHWNRFKWETAEREDCPWGPTLLQGIGIVPPYIVRPDLVYKHGRWAPFGRGIKIASDVHAWSTIRGWLYHFKENGILAGHVYVGSDHPDGHTPCLICRDGCGHVARALELEAQT